IWVTATVYHHAIRFKMDNKKHIVNLESVKDMLHICPRVHGQTFAEPPFEEEILAFICFIGHSAAIRALTNVKHKNHKKSTEMYYPRFTKVIVHHFMSKNPSIPRKNKMNWHYVRDDYMFSTIKLVSRHQNTQQFGVLLPIELRNEEMKNSNAYKEYYAIATGAAPPKPKDSVKRTRSSSDTSITPLLLQNSTDDEGTNNEGKDGDDDEEDEGDDGIGLNIVEEEGHVEEEEEDELYRDSSSVSSQFVTSMLNPTLDVGMESIFESTSQIDAQTPTLVAPFPMTAPTMSPLTIATITTTSQAPILPTTVLSTISQNLPNFGSMFRFDNRLRTLEANFSEFTQTNQFAGVVSAIPGIVQQYMDQCINVAVKVAVQIQSDHLRDEAQRENDEFLKSVDENMQKIIKEQVKEQVKVQVSKILPRIEQALNEQLKAEKMKGNKSIQRSDEQRNLYKAFVEAYESDKIILDTYEETVTLKRRRDDDANKDEEPFVGPDRGSKRCKEGKELESASAPTKTPGALAGRRVIPFEHFINNDLEYLYGGASSRKYTTSITKMKAVDYEHIKWIEELVPRTMWIEEPIGYDKNALLEVSHWGCKRQQIYGFAVNRESAHDVYSKRSNRMA
nr:hypothetical protein [Tanacetum cinerariifolium]